MAITQSFLLQRGVGRVLRGVEGWMFAFEIRTGIGKLKAYGENGSPEKVKGVLPEQMV